ncbi:FUSC family protein [Agrobacterium rosae]|uniref:FUSC family protein n=1 Tax=Agrobacterium rosae TaxID=1972867 RepID=UPI00203414F7|nr:FUSC family protein [Agrobacterium rosae]
MSTGQAGRPKGPRPSAEPSSRAVEFAIRTTIAALIAFSIAQFLDVQHPWWAAMTVWLVAQPTRGLLLERSLARTAGTICGATAGGAILVFWAQDTLVALMLLSFWLAVSTGIGTSFRHFGNYGFVLAGYTAAIVVLFGLGNDHTEFVLAQDRVFCTLLGIVCSSLLSFHALPRRIEGFELRSREIIDRTLKLVATGLRRHKPDYTYSLINQIGVVDRAIDEQAAGSVCRRTDALRLHHISGLLLELVALAKGTHEPFMEPVRTPTDPRLVVREMASDAAARGHTAFAHTLQDIATALDPDRLAIRRYLRFDFDPVAACRAAARPVLALVIASTVWLATDWHVGSMMIMTAILFTALFSNHDQGSHMVVQVLLGSLTGATTGIAVRLFLLPQVEGLLATIICIAPFLLFVAWLMRQSTTAKMAIDMAMTFLLTAQPGSAPMAGDVVVAEAIAIVAGVLIAVALFWLLLPSTPAVHQRLLAHRIARLTRRIAASTDRQAAVSTHALLRSANVRLLSLSGANSILFASAQDCVATAAQALSTTATSARESALSASAALNSLATSNTRRKYNG